MLPDREAGIVARKLNDGRQFHIVKLFYRPEDLAAMLADLGWSASIGQTTNYFIYGEVQRHASR
jgi:hypothetical protein